jgi:hypothetical protein
MGKAQKEKPLAYYAKYLGGHKAFPQPKLCEMYFYEYRFEPQDYLPSI